MLTKHRDALAKGGVLISGAPAPGEAEALRAAIGCAELVEDWTPGDAFRPGVLHVTPRAYTAVRGLGPAGHVMTLATARIRAGGRAGVPFAPPAEVPAPEADPGPEAEE